VLALALESFKVLAELAGLRLVLTAGDTDRPFHMRDGIVIKSIRALLNRKTGLKVVLAVDRMDGTTARRS
jgi:hypothetical protein